MLMGCNCGVQSLRGMRGLGESGLPQGYQITGYCPGTNMPNYVMKPDGSQVCYSDADLARLMNLPVESITQTDPVIGTPGTVTSQPTTGGTTTTTTPTANGGTIITIAPNPSGAASSASASGFDPIAFAKQYWMWLAGGAALFFLAKG